MLQRFVVLISAIHRRHYSVQLSKFDRLYCPTLWEGYIIVFSSFQTTCVNVLYSIEYQSNSSDFNTEHILLCYLKLGVVTAVLCFAVLWCAVVCFAVLCCGALWCGVLWCAVLCCGALWCAVVCCGVLCCGVLCCTFLSSLSCCILFLLLFLYLVLHYY